jgi:hypothetical protein
MSGIKNTFGAGIVAERLVEKIGSNRLVFRKVSKFYVEYNTTLNTFQYLVHSDGKFWRNMLRLYVEERNERVNDIIEEDKGGSYLRNLMAIKKREVLDIVEAIIKEEKKYKRLKQGYK